MFKFQEVEQPKIGLRNHLAITKLLQLQTYAAYEGASQNMGQPKYRKKLINCKWKMIINLLLVIDTKQYFN